MKSERPGRLLYIAPSDSANGHLKVALGSAQGSVTLRGFLTYGRVLDVHDLSAHGQCVVENQARVSDGPFSQDQPMPSHGWYLDAVRQPAPCAWPLGPSCETCSCTA